jgi:uncharacterized protein (TIGR03663 family)
MIGIRWLLIGAIAAGILLRLPQLGLRPMHTDEAVHAIKFGALLETGTYRYDRNEYHGPTLNYLTLLPAWLLGEKTLAEVHEITLRCVPVFFGICLILLPLLLCGIGKPAVAAIVMLTAVSPAMTFYSRYYIQEVLLVFFSFSLIVAVSRLSHTGRMRWAVVAGACAGLMFATKETWVISFSAMTVSGLLALLFRKKRRFDLSPVRFRHIAAAAITGAVVAAAFFSSFSAHWQGVADSVLAYETYFRRASGTGSHIHPWYYYLQMLTFWQKDQGPVWSEAAILCFSVVGGISVWVRNASMKGKGHSAERFIFWYAVLMMLVYSIIPYKTPWVMLGALHGMIMLAGLGVAQLLEWCDRVHLRRAGVVLLFACVAHLGWQAYRANFQYYESPENPHVYAHTTNDVNLIVEKVFEAVSFSPERLATPVQVIVPGDQYWPLPWYLRKLSHVGWWSGVTDDLFPTAVILTSPEVEPALLQRLYEKPNQGPHSLYVPLFEGRLELRPGIEIAGHVTSDLRSSIQAGKK